MTALRSIPFDRRFTLPDRTGLFQLVMADAKTTDRGKTLVRVSPVVGNTLDVRNSFWADWETAAVVVPRSPVPDDPKED